MPKKYTTEQFWKLYAKLPKELKGALSADETADDIYNICKRYEILENLDEMAEYVGHVLVGVLPPDEFQETLEKKMELEKDIAKKVTQEINRFIFYPVKANLEELYKIEIAPLAKMPVTPPPQERPPAPPAKEDVYREPLE